MWISARTNSDSKAEASNYDDTTIEKVVELLQQGKQLQSKEDNWNAANKFVQAQQVLGALAGGQSRETEEEQQIADLYKQQAR